MRSLRHAVPVALVAIALTHASTALAQSGPLRFGIGPLQPTPADTEKAYEPFFAYLAKKLDRPYDLIATSDWAGIAVALANDQVDSRGWGRGDTSSPTTTQGRRRSPP